MHKDADRKIEPYNDPKEKEKDVERWEEEMKKKKISEDPRFRNALQLEWY